MYKVQRQDGDDSAGWVSCAVAGEDLPSAVRRLDEYRASWPHHSYRLVLVIGTREVPVDVVEIAKARALRR